MKRIFFLLCILLTLSSVSAEPVNAGFFDWVKGFFTSDEETQTTNTTSTPIDDEINVSISGETFRENQIIELINSNEGYKTYINKLGYECFHVIVENNDEFSIIFDLENSMVEDLSKIYKCESEIKIEEGLINQIQEEGFDSSKIKEYRKQIDVPFGVYWALGKDYLN